MEHGGSGGDTKANKLAKSNEKSEPDGRGKGRGGGSFCSVGLTLRGRVIKGLCIWGTVFNDYLLKSVMVTFCCVKRVITMIQS